LPLQPLLSVVGRLGVGLDNIDVDACAARDIAVIPATGANALAVAEYVICMAMMLLRGAYRSSSSVAAGEWPRATLSRGKEVSGKTLGIVGFGSIGRLTGRIGHAMGMRVVGFDALTPDHAAVWAEEATEPHSLDALLAIADVVSLHVPLTRTTRHLIDAGGLRR
jgi:(S)-sulfolactate dehydrogenase